MKKNLLFVFLFLSQVVFAQKEHYIWCFGDGAGLDFNSGSPVAFSGVAMDQFEGCASIADTTGQLLFYTDGVSVWDKDNIVMPNGTGLMGNSSTTESGFIVRQPGSLTIFYLFSVPVYPGSSGFFYSIVDMSLNGGLGDVTVKNTLLLPNTDERVGAILNANGTDVWVITTVAKTDTVKSFLLTSSGINPVPVSCYTGSSHAAGMFNSTGYLRPSLSGKRLAIACHSSAWEVYDYDNATGLVSNQIVLPAIMGGNSNGPYGIEFSPDETRLYGSYEDEHNLYQWDLTAGTQQDIINSQVLVFNSTSRGAALQLGPDQKLYVSWYGVTSLGLVSNPNGLGVACNYTDNAVYLGGASATYGLPNFAPSSTNNIIIQPMASFESDTLICAGNCVNFTNLSSNATSYAWSFPGAITPVSTAVNPTVCYTNTGEYDVQLIATNGSNSDTVLVKRYIQVDTLPVAGTITRGRDSICAGSGITSTLNSSGGNGSVQWQSSTDGVNFTDISNATGASYTTSPTLSQTTTYRLQTTGYCGTATSNTVVVHIVPAPSTSFVFAINKQQVTFDTSNTSSNVVSYSWDFGDSTTSYVANPVHQFSRSAIFYVCVTVYNNSNCSYTLCQYVNLLNTGVESVAGDNLIRLYPNPANNTINLSVDGLTGNYDVKIYNVLGQNVGGIHESPLHTGETIPIDLSTLAQGEYELVLVNDTEYYSTRFVKVK